MFPISKLLETHLIKKMEDKKNNLFRQWVYFNE